MGNLGNNRAGAIGVFDSGVGGLTILKEIVSLLPSENTIYLGDTARVPYGSKPAETVVQYALEDASFLSKQEVKALVIACNTICCQAKEELTRAFNVPIIDVIAPATKAAVAITKNKRIGVIGTEGTINSSAYSQAIGDLNGEIEVFPKACPLLAPIVEENILEGEIAQRIVDMYIDELKTKGIDTLVLGCTHYPLLKECIVKSMGSMVAVLDPAMAVVNELKQQLEQHDLLNDQMEGYHKFYFTGNPEKAEKLILHMNIKMESIEKVSLT